jgi:hypothetical protein
MVPGTPPACPFLTSWAVTAAATLASPAGPRPCRQTWRWPHGPARRSEPFELTNLTPNFTPYIRDPGPGSRGLSLTISVQTADGGLTGSHLPP